jgi:hypothetical protein
MGKRGRKKERDWVAVLLDGAAAVFFELRDLDYAKTMAAVTVEW